MNAEKLETGVGESLLEDTTGVLSVVPPQAWMPIAARRLLLSTTEARTALHGSSTSASAATRLSALPCHSRT